MTVLGSSAAAEDVKEQTNGHVKGPISGRAPTPSRTYPLRIFNVLARLTVWYAILTVVFRCPSAIENLNDSSPQICKPYLATRSQIRPYVQPYYDSYASPYVEKARPYVQQLDDRLITPASKVAKSNYNKYASPRFDQVKIYGQQRWEQAVLPRVHVAQKGASDVYQSSIAPHVGKVSALTDPYYVSARDIVVRMHHDVVLPGVETAKPRVIGAYQSLQGFVVETGLPHAQNTWSGLVIFVDGVLWPRIRGLYGDNVKPQLLMISERIAKYQESRRLKAAMDQVESSIAASSSTPSPLSTETALTITPETVANPTSSAATPTPEKSAPTSEEQIAAARDQIAADLHSWQRKFAVAADKGAEDLAGRVKDIIATVIKSEIDGEGKALAKALNLTSSSEITNVKEKIKSIAASLPDQVSSTELGAAEERVLETIRAAAKIIRHRADSVRQWNRKFENSLIARATAASDSTLDVLDGIRDLGLQEIGMRWAWMEGVTYKDWAKYHELKKQFEEWRSEVRDVALRHEIFEEAKKAAEVIVEQSMDVAADAAKTLARLKDVGKQKVHAHDSSDDFEIKVLPAAAVSVASSVSDYIKHATSSLTGPSQGTFESVISSASNVIAADASTASAALKGADQGVAESVFSRATESAADGADSASSVVIGLSQGSVESLHSSIGRVIGEVASDASSSIMGESGSKLKDAVSMPSRTGSIVVQGTRSRTRKAADTVSSVTDSISSLASGIYEAIEPPSSSRIVAGADNVVDAGASPASSVASKMSSKFFAGAMAQELNGQLPILDDIVDDGDDSTFSEKLQNVVSEAGDRYVDVTKAVSEAIYGTAQGTAESVTSIASERYSSALAVASSVLYGGGQGTAQRLSGVANEKYSEAIAAASAAIYGTPTPYSQTLAAKASSAYAAAVSRAQENYAHAKSIASQQISGTPKPIHEEMSSSIESAYSGALSTASGRLQAALSGAASQYSSWGSASSPTQGTLDSISSLASSKLKDALSLASAQYSSAKTAVGATPTPVHQQYLMDAQRNYYAAVGLAHERYSEFVSAASEAVYGAPTPALSSISIAASRAVYGTSTPLLSSISSAASTAVYGTPVAAYQSLLDAASSQYAAASSIAGVQFDALLPSGISTKPPAKGVLSAASSQYNAAMSAASASLSVASQSASEAIYGSPVPDHNSLLNAASSRYAAASSLAAANLDAILSSATSVVGATTRSPAQKVLDSASAQYDAALSMASQSLSDASYLASVAIYGPPTGTFQSAASAASQNWEALVAKARERVYGAPTPVYGSVISQAGAYGSHVTDSAAAQYAAVQAYVSELVVGKEPDFTDSVMNRLSAAYHTGYHVTLASSASSMASEAYVSISSVASSVSSAVSAVGSTYFTPPPQIESILNSVTDQLNSAIDAASVQAYGTTKGSYEQATSAAAESYASASKVVSEAIYGTQTRYAESAQIQISHAMSSAQDAISVAIYGTPTDTVASATGAAAEAYISVSSVMADKVVAAGSAVGDTYGSAVTGAGDIYSSATAKVSEAIYGPEQGAVESAQARLMAAVESAQAKLAAFASAASQGASETYGMVSSQVESMASNVTARVKDEL